MDASIMQVHSPVAIAYRSARVVVVNCFTGSFHSPVCEI
jgi:hypothetical protein